MARNVNVEEMKGGGALSRPTIYKDKLVFGNGEGYIYCLDKNNGKEIWRTYIGGSIYAPVVVKNNHLYVGSKNTNFYKLNMKGELIWKFKTGGTVTGATSYKNGLLFVSADNYIYSVDENGNLNWKFKTGDEVFVDPTVHNERIYFGASDEYFYCLDLEGNLVWKFKTGGEILTFDGLDVVDGKIYFGSADQYIYCLNLNGKLVWKKRTGDIVFSTPRIKNNRLYIAGRDGKFYCLDKDTKDTIWTYRYDAPSDMTPVLVNDLIVFASYAPQKKIYALNQNGKKIWEFKAKETPTTPVTDGKNIYFCCLDSHVQALSKNGKHLWTVLKGSGETIDLSNVIPEPKLESEHVTLQTELKMEESPTDTYKPSGVKAKPEKIGEDYGGSEIGGQYEQSGVGEDYAGSSESKKEAHERRKREIEELERQGRM